MLMNIKCLKYINANNMLNFFTGQDVIPVWKILTEPFWLKTLFDINQKRAIVLELQQPLAQAWFSYMSEAVTYLTCKNNI